MWEGLRQKNISRYCPFKLCHPYFFFQLFIAFDQTFKTDLTKLASQRPADNMLKA
jgi:hypothetical protein